MIKKKGFYTGIIALVTLSSCREIKCSQDINLQPMYGGKCKCTEQQESDLQFLKACDREFKSRSIAAKKYVDLGWEYFYKDDWATAMKRFNQAWLLDSMNADVYWGFGNLLGMHKEFKQSILFLEKSIQLNANNSSVYECLGISNSQLFFETEDELALGKAISNWKKAITLDSSNARLYGRLTNAYCHYNQKDSARKYLSITDKMDTTLVGAEVRQIIEEH